MWMQNTRILPTWSVCLLAISFLGGPTPQLWAEDEPAVGALIATLRGVGREGAGFDDARKAATRLSELPVDRLTVLLDGMDGANPIAENWIRGLVFSIAGKADELPLEMLSDYAMTRSHNPSGRGLAMELIRNQSPATADELIAKCLDDPSLPLREMAVQRAINEAQRVVENDPQAAQELYRQALLAARHPNQIVAVVKALKELGLDDVSISTAFAMITRWKALAPLNNVDGVGFDKQYAPEKEFLMTGSLNLDATHEGKSGSIRWRDLEATDEDGKLDLAAAFNKEKGAVCYLYTEFDSSEARPAQVRLGCINANKVWVNGQLVLANEVYHSGSMIDQYVADIRLRQGNNGILLKICQNEQTESWAQEWEFQFRITDPMGRGLRSGE
jgi:hypothetical protein